MFSLRDYLAITLAAHRPTPTPSNTNGQWSQPPMVSVMMYDTAMQPVAIKTMPPGPDVFPGFMRWLILG